MAGDRRISMDRPSLPVQAAHFLNNHHNLSARIAVAIDGSTISEKALGVASRLLHRERAAERLLLLHVYDKNKTYLPNHLSPEHLKQQYEKTAQVLQIPTKWRAKQREETRSTCESLTDLAHEHHVDVLVVGSYGRKGEKIDMLGTVSDHSLRECNSHICIVKSTSYEPQASNRWLFATDNSLAAQTAFAVLMYQMRKPGDTVDVIYATSGEEPAGLMRSYEQMLKDAHVAGRCYSVGLAPGGTIASAICDAAKQSEVDVLVLGICGYGKQKLGSVSEECSRTSTVTTLVIKDPYEVQEQRALLGVYD